MVTVLFIAKSFHWLAVDRVDFVSFVNLTSNLCFSVYIRRHLICNYYHPLSRGGTPYSLYCWYSLYLLYA